MSEREWGTVSSHVIAYRFFLASPKTPPAFLCGSFDLDFSMLGAALLPFSISQMVLFLPPSHLLIPQRPAVPGTFGPLRGSDPTKLYGSPRVPEPHPGDPVQQHQHFAMQVKTKKQMGKKKKTHKPIASRNAVVCFANNKSKGTLQVPSAPLRASLQSNLLAHRCLPTFLQLIISHSLSFPSRPWD